jgi:hypothetical protein
VNENGEKLYTLAEVEAMVEQRLSELREVMEQRVNEARAEGIEQGKAQAQQGEAQRLEAARAELETQVNERMAALDQREADIARRELRAGAIETLREKGLPETLADCLDYAGAEACEASIQRVEAVMRKAIQEGVDQRIVNARHNLSRGERGAGALLAQVRGVMGLK